MLCAYLLFLQSVMLITITTYILKIMCMELCRCCPPWSMFQYASDETSMWARLIFSSVCIQFPKVSISLEIFSESAVCFPERFFPGKPLSLATCHECRRTGKGMWVTYSRPVVLFPIEEPFPLDKVHEDSLHLPWNEFTSLRATLLLVTWQSCRAHPKTCLNMPAH